jgi:outer membrane receptor for ferrienterochelin and colicins
MKRRFVRRLLSACALVLLSGGALTAQTGTITGTVRIEGTESPVPNAVIQVISATGGRVGSSLTNQSGRYLIANIPPGSYSVTATMTGYQTARVDGVNVAAGQAATVNLNLVTQAIDLDPVVVSASRRQERALDAPARVEVVSTREIAERPAASPAEHLRNTPGVDIASTGLQSTNVVARGFNNIFSGALHTLTDHRIAGVPSLRVNLLHFVPSVNEDLERMEVVLGPGAALYGPNTANGVLHLLTKSPLTYQGTVVTTAAGERNLLHTTFRTAHLLGEDFGFKVSGQYLVGNEWQYIDRAETIERDKFASNLPFHRADLMRSAGIDQAEADRRIARIGARDFDIERYSAEARADWRIRPDWTTVFSAGLNHSASGIELTGLGAGQAQDWRTTYVQARTNWNRLFAQAYVNANDAGDTYLLRNGAPIVDRSKLYVAQIQHGMSLGERQNFTYGADYLFTDPQTEGTINGIYEDNDDTQEFGAYLQSETRLSEKFDLVLAGRIDTHSALPEAIFSPRAAVVFKPSQEQAFRVTYNRAFSTPSSLTQFLDLGSSIPNPTLAQLGYSLRVQGSGRDGFSFRTPAGNYQMRSPFTPQQLGGPGQLLPADASSMWAAAVGVVAVQAAGRGAPLPSSLVQYLSSLRPTSAQISSMYLDVTAAEPTPQPLADLNLEDVPAIRESTSDTYELGYKGILGGRVVLAADVWYSQRNNLVTPLTIQTPLITMNGQQIGGYLVPRFMQDLQMSQAEAVALASQLAPGLASVPVGVISDASINANGPQLLVTYVNVDESINVWGTDLSATALLTDSWQLGVSASWVNENVFTTNAGFNVMLNAPAKKGTVSLGYRNPASPFNGELRARYSDSFPVNSGVYIGSQCLDPTSTNPLIEPCVDSYTLMDANVGYRVPGLQGASLNLSVQNLLNESYRSFPGSPEIGRMAMLRLRYEF